ncbi:MAG TPA: hypothetical protein VLJ86_12965 [Ramlibacter sp.]|nr:hypothetical protein [Ramlibacter sp.]
MSVQRAAGFGTSSSSTTTRSPVVATPLAQDQQSTQAAGDSKGAKPDGVASPFSGHFSGASYSATHSTTESASSSADKSLGMRRAQTQGAGPLSPRSHSELQVRFDAFMAEVTGAKDGAEVPDFRESFAALVMSLATSDTGAQASARYGASLSFLVDGLLAQRDFLSTLFLDYSDATGNSLFTELMDVLCARVKQTKLLLQKVLELDRAPATPGAADPGGILLRSVARTRAREDRLQALSLGPALFEHALAVGEPDNADVWRRRIVAGLMHVPESATDRVRPLVGLASQFVSDYAHACAKAHSLEFRWWIGAIIEDITRAQNRRHTAAERMGLAGYAMGLVFSRDAERTPSVRHHKVICELLYARARSIDADAASGGAEYAGGKPGVAAPDEREIDNRMFAAAHGLSHGQQRLDAVLGGAPKAIVHMVSAAQSRGYVFDADPALAEARNQLMLSNLLLQPDLQYNHVQGVLVGLPDAPYLQHLAHVRLYMPLPPEFEAHAPEATLQAAPVGASKDAKSVALGVSTRTERDAKAGREGLDEVLRHPGEDPDELRAYVRHISTRNAVSTDGAVFGTFLDKVALPREGLPLRLLQVIATGLFDAAFHGDGVQAAANVAVAGEFIGRMPVASPEEHGLHEAIHNAYAIARKDRQEAKRVQALADAQARSRDSKTDRKAIATQSAKPAKASAFLSVVRSDSHLPADYAAAARALNVAARPDMLEQCLNDIAQRGDLDEDQARAASAGLYDAALVNADSASALRNMSRIEKFLDDWLDRGVDESAFHRYNEMRAALSPAFEMIPLVD